MSQSPSTRDEPLAYLNGKRIPRSQAAISVFDGGFMQGTTVAEQLRTFGRRLFRLEMHLERLARSLTTVGVIPGIALEEIGKIATELTAHNARLLDHADDQNVTIFITPGIYSAYTGVTSHAGPTVGIHTQPLPFSQWADKYRTGESLVVTDVRQVPGACWPAELKCRSRMHYYLADKKAREIQPGARAVLIDERGFVMEASTANILVYRASEGLISPPKEHILAGVTVAVLEELAGQLKIPFVHRDLSVTECAAADEILLCSTSPCVLSVTTFNGQPIAHGQPGQIAERLRAAWDAMVGFDIAAQSLRFAKR